MSYGRLQGPFWSFKPQEQENILIEMMLDPNGMGMTNRGVVWSNTTLPGETAWVCSETSLSLAVI